MSADVLVYTCLLTAVLQHVGAACSSSLLDPEIVKLSHGEDIKVLNSPNWPRDYGTNELCYWHVTGPSGHVIGWRFHPDFALEETLRCRNDYVRLYDGRTDTDMIGAYCGFQLPVPGNTTGHSLLIKFRSDSVNQYPGFRLAVQVGRIPERVPDDPLAVYITVGVVVGISSTLSIIIFIILCYYYKRYNRNRNLIGTRRSRRRADEEPEESLGQYNPPQYNTSQQRARLSSPTAPRVGALDSDPPAYSPPTPPPTYEEAVRQFPK